MEKRYCKRYATKGRTQFPEFLERSDPLPLYRHIIQEGLGYDILHMYMQYHHQCNVIAEALVATSGQ